MISKLKWLSGLYAALVFGLVLVLTPMLTANRAQAAITCTTNDGRSGVGVQWYVAADNDATCHPSGSLGTYQMSLAPNGAIFFSEPFLVMPASPSGSCFTDTIISHNVFPNPGSGTCFVTATSSGVTITATIPVSGGAFVFPVDVTFSGSIFDGPIGTSFIAGGVAQNSSGNSIDAATGSSIQGSPTSYAVGSATTSQGGSVSINSSGIATYTPAVGFSGNDTFTFTATNPGGTSSPITVTVPVIATPTVTAVSPSSGTTAGGTTVVITGTNFTGVTAVNFGSTPSSFTFDSATQITATAPARSAGAVDVRVTTAGGTSAINPADQFTYIVPLTTAQAVAATSLTANSVATPFTPVTASGGFGTISFAVSPALPTGLSFNTTNGEVSGTPSALLATATFTVTATDSATPTPQTSSKTFLLTVNPATLTTVQAVPATTLTANSAATPFTPVTASGGFGTVSFAVSPALPTGLSFNTTNGEVSGTPTVLLATATFTVTATDSATPTPQTSSKTFLLTVNPATLTTVQAVPATTLTANSVATPFTPVTASGGFGTVSFAVSPALPTGLSFNTTNGQVSGTPSALLATSTFTVTATDSTTPTPQSSSKTFQLTVNPVALTTVQAVPATTLTANSVATPFTPVTASGGFGTVSFAVSPALPTGLSFNTTNGQVSGTPTALLATSTFTVTATDSATPTVQTSSQDLSAHRQSSPRSLTTVQAVPATTLTAGSVATPFTPVTASGGFGTVSFAVSPALPTGLSFNTTNGQVSGTPTALLATSTFTVTATDSTTPTPQTSSKTFQLTVNPVALTTVQAVPATTLTANSVATPFTPVTASGGFGTISFAVSPALPTGLSFNTTNGEVSGTPSALLATSTFTVTATDSATPAAQTSSKTFQLAVNPVALTTVQAVLATTLTANSAATPFTPVTASGGFGTVSFAVSPALPTGLSFNTTNGQVSGTPTALLATSTFTVTATDSTTPAAQTSAASFNLTINAAVSATSLTASSTAPNIGEAVTLSAVVTPTAATGTVTFTDGATVLCQSVPLSTGSASCTASFASGGTHSLVASYSGDTSFAGSSASLNLSVSDQGRATAEAIGGFLSDRANQIVSNQFDGSRQIDRLQQAGQQQGGGSGSQFAVAEGKSDFGNGAAAEPPSSRLGGGPDAAAFSAAGQFASAAQDPFGVQSMLYDYLSSSADSREYRQFRFSGPFEASARLADGFSGSFKASLSQMMSWEARQEVALGYGSSSAGSTYMPVDVWAEGTYSSYGGERSGRFGMLTIGTDYVFNPNFLIGFYGQYDNSKQTSGVSIKGQGWMIGPYATARLGENVFWQGKAAWGKSSNDIEATGTGSFDSTRWLASSALVGRWQFENGISFSPALSFIYFEDKADSYVDSLGGAIPGVTTKLGQLKLSPEIAYGFELGDGTWVEPGFSPELLWNFASTHMDGLGSLNSDAAGPEGLRGRVKAGLTIRTPAGINFAGSASYDGIGSSGYHSVTGQAQVSIPLN